MSTAEKFDARMVVVMRCLLSHGALDVPYPPDADAELAIELGFAKRTVYYGGRDGRGRRVRTQATPTGAMLLTYYPGGFEAGHITDSQED